MRCAERAGVLYLAEEEAQEDKVMSGHSLDLMISKVISSLVDSVIL